MFELARWRNAQGPVPVIPPSIIERPPSAELRPGQKDSDSLPPYEVLDPILAKIGTQKQWHVPRPLYQAHYTSRSSATISMSPIPHRDGRKNACRGNSKSGKPERAKAERAWSEQKRKEMVSTELQGKGLRKGYERKAPPRGRAPAERAKAECGLR